MKILALDIATKTGWSLPDESGTYDLTAERDALRAKGIEPKSNDEADAIALRLLVESTITEA